MDDNTTTINELKQLVAEFVAERDWQQFHSPKNISMSIAIEAAELMEHFQWISMQESHELNSDPEKREQVRQEMADVFSYLVALANTMEIDLADAVQQKMKKNRQKYPAEEFKGRYGYDDPSHNPAQD